MEEGKYQAAVVTVSDSVAAGRREDKSGPKAAAMLEAVGIKVLEEQVVDDDYHHIKEILIELCDRGDIDLVITSGGTGFSPLDVTPEATAKVIDRQAHNLAEFIRYECYKQSPKAALSRGIAGISGSTLVVNLPGSPAAVEESLTALFKILDHALLIMKGGQPH